jgi:hypothetical protein
MGGSCVPYAYVGHLNQELRDSMTRCYFSIGSPSKAGLRSQWTVSAKPSFGARHIALIVTMLLAGVSS